MTLSWCKSQLTRISRSPCRARLGSKCGVKQIHPSVVPLSFQPSLWTHAGSSFFSRCTTWVSFVWNTSDRIVLVSKREKKAKKEQDVGMQVHFKRRFGSVRWEDMVEKCFAVAVHRLPCEQ